MIKEIEIVCPPGQQEDEIVLKKIAANSLNINLQKINSLQILKRSIDARGRRVVYRMQVKVYVDETYEPKNYTKQYPNVQNGKPVIIVGAGPAGLFAALQCIEQEQKPIVLERGKPVKERRRDLANINKQGLV